MDTHLSSRRNRKHGPVLILIISMLFLVGGVLAPLMLEAQAGMIHDANGSSALYQLAPTPSVVPPQVEPLPTEEPTPFPEEPTPFPEEPTPDGSTQQDPVVTPTPNDVIVIDPSDPSTINIDMDSSPTPVPTEQPDSDTPSVRVVVRWCPFGSEVGGPRIDHPLIEKPCTLDGPDINIDLSRPDGSGESHSDSATRPFPATVDLTPVKPGKWWIHTDLPRTKVVQAVYCRVVEHDNNFQEVLPPRTQEPVFELNVEDALTYECNWYFVLPEDPDTASNDAKEDGKPGAVDVTTYACKGTPPRGADYGWFNKNCSASSGGSLELSNGEKDGTVHLQSAQSRVGYAANTEVAPGAYMLTQSGNTPLRAHSIWCATLPADQIASPSDYVHIPITRAGVSIEIDDGTRTSCKVFGPQIRGGFVDHYGYNLTHRLLIQK